jgi:hypothetical protein
VAYPRSQVTQSRIAQVAAAVNSSYDCKEPSDIGASEKALVVERPENGLQLDGGIGYEVDKLGGAEDGKQYSAPRKVVANGEAQPPDEGDEVVKRQGHVKVEHPP